MKINLLIQQSIILFLICQTTFFFSSCVQNNAAKTDINFNENNDCKQIKQYNKSYKTKLNKEVKAPQSFQTFDKVRNSIKLIEYQSDGRKLKALLDTTNIQKGAKKKAVVFLHGGFALGYQDVYDCKKFTDKDYILLAPSYRGENGNSGNYELLFGEVRDAKNAIKWLAKQDFVNKDSIYVFGHSIGGGLSLALTLHDDVPILTGGSCAGIYDIGTFEYWSKEDENQVPFDLKNELESSLRLPVYFLKCMERQHFMYIGKDDYFKENKEFVEQNLYSGKNLLIEFAEVEGNHFSSLDNSIDAFIKQIEK